jgi:hypothetical protein
MILPRPRRPHTRPVSNAQPPAGDDEGWTERDVEDDLERGIWDEGDDLDGGSGAHVVVAVPEPWPRTILAALWEGLGLLGAVALWTGLAAFGTEPTGPSEGVSGAELDAIGWRILGIYAAGVVAVAMIRRLHAPRVCRQTGAPVR